MKFMSRRAAIRIIPALALVAAMGVLVTALVVLPAGHASPRHALDNTAGSLAVYVGYAEDKGTNVPKPAAFPVPWQGSPNTTFLGNPVTNGTQNCGTVKNCYDTGAVRLDNTGSSPVSVSGVTVDVHSSISGGAKYNLWGSFTVPAGGSVILTQDPNGHNTGILNFDTSDNPSNCPPNPPISVQPTVTVTIGSTSTTLVDSTHVLDTTGYDIGTCKPVVNESIQWRPIGSAAAGSGTATLSLSSSASSQTIGQVVTETATLLDGSGNPDPNANVTFNVTGGPDKGLKGSASTNSAGQASFTYTGLSTGTDSISASVSTVGSFSSNTVSVAWANPSSPPPPVGLSLLQVSDSTNALNWSLQTNFQTGNVQYGDRGYSITGAPAALLGSSWIRTANGSKTFTGNPTVTFTIGQPAIVYVAEDTRLPKPGWMDSSWSATGVTITDNQGSGANTFALFAKLFPAGPVSLGPSDKGSSSSNMYTVIVLGIGTGGPPPPTPTPSPPTPTPTPGSGVQLGNLVVSDSANAANWSLQQSGFGSSVVQYGDRGYTISSLPSALAGAAWVRTANSSKAFTGTTLVSFSINESATVYVALDTRDAVPSWLSSGNGWTKTTMTMTKIEASGQNTFVLYSKPFGAGTVSLGPNDNGATLVNMYTVIVVP